MLTFESASVLGVNGIVEKLSVWVIHRLLTSLGLACADGCFRGTGN